MKAGDDSVEAESSVAQSLSVADGGQGHQGIGGEGGGVVHWRGREERVKRGMGGSRCLLWRLGGVGGEERGAGGVRGRRRVEGGNGQERGGPGCGRDSSSSQHRPPTGGCERRRCHATGEGGGARAADRRDRATMEPGGQRLGAGRALISGPSQHSTGRHG
jgi:hypothetical protein